jgi:hypothetical protein
MSDQELAPSKQEAIDEIDALIMGEPERETDPEPVDESPALEPDEVEILDDEPAIESEAEPEEENSSIDYDLEIPMPGGGDTIKLGALKDRVVELERGESAMIDRENDLLRKTQEFSEALQAAGGEIPQELKQRMSKQMEVHLEREHDLMMQAIPEWKDKATFDSDRQSIAKVGKEYGFSPDDISSIADHRVIKFMRDYARLKAQEEKAQANIVKLRDKPKPRGKPRGISKPKISGTMDEQIAAIDKLIQSG